MKRAINEDVAGCRAERQDGDVERRERMRKMRRESRVVVVWDEWRESGVGTSQWVNDCVSRATKRLLGE